MNRSAISALLGGVSAVALSISAEGVAGTLPSGGHFASGHGDIGKAGQSVTVKQSSTTGIIDWNSFSVGKHESVTFNNGSGATLSRVTAGNLSRIEGSLHATGSLYLLNSSGVIISGTGHVVTGESFVASGGNIANSAFDDGERRFKPGAGNVINKGTIVSGGSASLVGRNVSDSGSIRATGAYLSATHRLGISGGIIARAANGGGGAVTSRAGTIVIGTDGDINASAAGADPKSGTISVVARRTTTIAGTLSANGGSNGSGGFIETSGEHLHVADTAKISTLAANGKTGTWLIDPKNFTIAASGGDITGAMLSTELASNDVDIRSSDGANAGNGDIFVDDAVTWSSGSTLTLDAHRSIHINNAVTVSGAGGLVLITNDHGSGGDYDFGLGADGFAGHVAFNDVVSGNTQGSLEINGTDYSLAKSLSQLVSDIAAAPTGSYALANSYNAARDGNYTDTLIKYFTGMFEGLGNVVSNLSIHQGARGDIDVGLFGEADGSVRDVGLVNAKVVSDQSGASVGTLIGYSQNGFVEDDFATGKVSASGAEDVGGLIGSNFVDVASSYAAVSVSGGDNAGGLIGYSDNSSASIKFSYATGQVVNDGTRAGGLLGYDSSKITNSYATGDVTGGKSVGGLVGEDGEVGRTDDIISSYASGDVSSSTAYASVGGLVGVSAAAISDSFATGNVVNNGSNEDRLSLDAGGLVGENDFGSIKSSYATGSVSATQTSADVGGLVGINANKGASIVNSYATGTVSASDQSVVGGLVGNNEDALISGSFASGRVSGGNGAVVGGLVGTNLTDVAPVDGIARIKNSYSMGTVVGGQGAIAGGLVGDNSKHSSVAESFAIGDVIVGASGVTGGLVGSDESNGKIKESYWNIETTGQAFGAGNLANDAGITNVTTAELEAALPSGFSSSVWEIVRGTSLPYLKWQFAGAPEVVSGVLSVSVGAAGIADSSVSLLQDGANLNSVLTGGSVTTYANGFYYFLLAPGSIATNANAGLLVYDASQNSEAFADRASTSIIGLNLTANFLNDQTSGTAWSAVNSDLANAVNGNGAINTLISATPNLEIGSTDNFTIDQALNLGSGTLFLDGAAGTVSQSSAIIASNLLLEGGADFTLNKSSNSIDTVAMDGAGALALTDGNELTVGTVENVDGIDAKAINDGGVKLVTKRGDIVIAQRIVSGDSANARSITFVSAGTISETGSSSLNGNTVTGSSKGAVDLSSTSNSLTDLGPFISGGDFVFVNHRAIDGGDINAGKHEVELTTMGSKSNYINVYDIHAGKFLLVSAGGSEMSDINVKTLTGSAAGSVSVSGFQNKIAKLGTFTSKGFELYDEIALTVDGTLNNGSHSITLITFEPADGIIIDAQLQGGIVSLGSAAGIAEGNLGKIDAKTLLGSANGTVVLTSATNAISNLGVFTTDGNAFSLIDDHSLRVNGLNGNVSTASAALNLTTTSGDISIDADLDGGTVNLMSAGQVTESSHGAVDTNLLNVSAQTGISLTSSNNNIVMVGTDTTTSGPNDITQ